MYLLKSSILSEENSMKTAAPTMHPMNTTKATVIPQLDDEELSSSEYSVVDDDHDENIPGGGLGVGEWTAQYIALRELRELEAADPSLVRRHWCSRVSSRAMACR